LIPFFDATQQYHQLKEEIDAEIASVLRNGRFILGPQVEAFEAEFAAYCGARFAVGLANGTEAIALALAACDIGPGDEVITAANTSVFTALGISMVGARPRLVDIDPWTFTLDPAQLKASITPRTRAIIPVHLYGQPAEMASIMTVARQRSLYIVEDACQAHGAKYREQRVGSIGHLAAFSFYPTKNLGAYGDGGAVVKSDAALAEKLRWLRDGGRVDRYRHVICGYNSRLDEIHATVLRIKLRYLDEWNECRRTLAAHYSKTLEDTSVVIPIEASYARHVYHLYVVRSCTRDALHRYLADCGIQTLIHYPIPVHLQPAFAGLGYPSGSFPEAERACDEVLSLPMFPELREEQVDVVCETLKRWSA
jgi:dTDP-4-amino-4,6-dideoxygalactose transaminase